MGGLFETSILLGDLKNNYTKQEVLDYNAYGIIHKCKEAKTNQMVALKIINKKYLERICGNKNLEDCYESVRHEINCLKLMDGEYSIHLIEESEINEYIYIVMDLWDSNLEKYLKSKNNLTIEEIKTLFKKLNIAFKRMFDKNIIHGNLKLDNILIKFEKGIISPFLSDYGKKAALDDRLTIMQSSTHYSAPELLIGDDYDYKVDLWSIGIILYRLYFNEFPFNGDTQVAIFNDIKRKKHLKKSDNFYFDDLIKKLLIFDPNYRMTWEKYFSHKFWKYDEQENNSVLDENNLYEDIEVEDSRDSSDSDSEKNSNWKRESKYRSQRLKNKNLSYKSYSIYYCLTSNNKNNNEINKNNNINKSPNINLKDMKKIEIEIENNRIEEPIDNLIYKEIVKKIKLDKLTKLILYGCNLNNIDILTKLNPVNLLELDLSHNNINNLDDISSTSFDKLITLNLSYNKLSNLESLIDAPFIYLKNLNLSNNILYDIESLALVPFPELDRLKLSGNKIRDISVLTKVPFINCTYLELKNNKISEISNALSFISITNLLYLDLSHNYIKSIEGLNSSQFQKLITLNLGNNQISNIDLLKEVNFYDLNKLDLYDNNIEDVSIFGQVPFIKLKELNLSYNKIKNIDIINFMVFENLSKIDLNGNEISDLKPLNLSNKLKELKVLQLKNNKLKSNEENEIILRNIKNQYKELKIIYI